MTTERRFSQRAVPRLETREGGDKPVIRGYAAVFYDGTPDTEYELWDGARERIMPWAFKESLRGSDDVVAQFNHDANHVLGRRSASTLRLWTDDRGLLYEVDPPDTTLGRDVVELLRRGDVRGSSFMFQVRQEKWIHGDKTDVRELHELALFDVGPVTFPAYAATTAGVRTSAADEAARRSWQAWDHERRIAIAKAQGHAALIVAELYAEYL